MNGAIETGLPDTRTALVYDGECPACNAYVRFVRFRESVGVVEMLDAREGGDLVDLIRNAGLDLDEGMVLFYGGHMYHGADAIHMMSVLSSDSGVLNRLNAAVFRQPALAKSLYPVLRFGRNMLLRLLGRSPIELH